MGCAHVFSRLMVSAWRVTNISPCREGGLFTAFSMSARSIGTRKGDGSASPLLNKGTPPPQQIDRSRRQAFGGAAAGGFPTAVSGGMGCNELNNGQSSPHVGESYEKCMEALSSLITSRKRGDGSTRETKFTSMLNYVKLLGLEEHINGLNVIHVAGTKGKGSTCSFCDSILRECGLRTGLFTSPHLVDVRERYRIEGVDISEEKFLHYFWDCWKQLKEKMMDDLQMPPLFQFLTLLAFKIFISEEVDVAIIEVGLGGKWDPTNVVKEPVVCGITSLGMDHMEILGNSLREIALEKAGVLKPQVPAFTVPQLLEAMDVLTKRAKELMIPLEVVQPLPLEWLEGRQLGLAGDHQRINAGLAVSLCKYWLHTKGFLKVKPDDTALPQAFLKGLSIASLSGRAQIVQDRPRSSCKPSEGYENICGDLIFYLDGAHTPESMEVCVGWFSNAIMDNSPADNACQIENFNENHRAQSISKGLDKISTQVLLFNCMEARDPQLLLPKLTSLNFSIALFVPSMSCYHLVTSASSAIQTDLSVDTSWQASLKRTWERLMLGKDGIFANESNPEHSMKFPSYQFLHDDLRNDLVGKGLHCNAAVMPSLPMALNWLRDCAKENPNLRLQVLVTGSLHLVGDLLKLLRR